MAIETIPMSLRYICDVCGETHVQENAGAHYPNSRPPQWAHLKIERSAHDFQGMAVADASVQRLLCTDCTAPVLEAINKASEKLRAAAEAHRDTVKRAAGKA